MHVKGNALNIIVWSMNRFDLERGIYRTTRRHENIKEKMV